MKYIRTKLIEDFDPDEQIYTGPGELLGFIYSRHTLEDKPAGFAIYDGTADTDPLLIRISSGNSASNTQRTPMVDMFPDGTSIKFKTGLYFKHFSGDFTSPNSFTAFFQA